jgi:hypothetical protein
MNPRKQMVRITEEFYNAMLLAFRAATDVPGKLSHYMGCYKPISRMLGCDQRTVKRGWLQGWPPTYEAIKTVIEKEQAHTRLALARDQLEAAKQRGEADKAAFLARAKQSADEKTAEQSMAVEGRKIEGQIALGTRATTLRLLSMQERTAKAAAQLMPKIEAAILSGEITSQNALRLLSQLSANQRLLNDAAKTSIELTRLINGEPQSIVAVTSANMTVEEAAEIIKQAPSLAKRAQELGLFVLPGESAAAPSAPAAPGQPILTVVPKAVG